MKGLAPPGPAHAPLRHAGDERQVTSTLVLKTSYRPMSADERKLIVEQLSGGRSWSLFDLFIAWFFGMLGGVAVAMIFERWLNIDIHVDLLIVLGSVVGLFLGVREARRTAAMAAAAKSLDEMDLSGGRMEVLDCTVERAVKLEEFEDEGVGYFLDVGDSKILFLQGQYLYDVEDDGQFPNTHFVLTWAPHSRLVLDDPQCLGEPLMPIRTLDPEKVGAHVPEEGAIFAGNLATLDEDGLKAMFDGRPDLA